MANKKEGKQIKINVVTFWGALDGKRIIYERIGHEFLGCATATVGELSPSQEMVNLAGTWFDLASIKVKDILK